MYWDLSCGPASIKRPLAEKKAQPGDLIAIRYDGIGQTKSGLDYKRFKIATEPQGERIEGVFFDLERAEAESGNDLGFVDGWNTTPAASDPIESMPLWAREEATDDDEPAF